MIREITYIALGVASLIAGGFAILQVSMVFPIPGVKYILMSPYLSMVIFILLTKAKGKYALLKFATTFGMIMMVMNIFMGLAIGITAVLSQFSIIRLKASGKAFYGAIFFSAYTGVSALTISKYLVGGVFEEISWIWILLTGLICALFGFLGTILAKRITKHMAIAFVNDTEY
jgi:hypothetical protein